MNIQSTSGVQRRSFPPSTVPDPRPSRGETDQFIPTESQSQGLTLGSKLGMVGAVVGGVLVGREYAGLIGILVGLGTGSSIANDMAQANPNLGTAALAAGAGVGAMALGGHLGGFLGFLIGSGFAASATKFMLK